MMFSRASVVGVLVLLLSSCLATAHQQDPDPFNCSAAADQGAFLKNTLTNTNGTLTLVFVPYGGIVTNLFFSGKDGLLHDVVLGFDDPIQYCSNSQHPYFGALIGRVANRISNGSFQVNGQTYYTPINEPAGNDTLHGGPLGFDRRIWNVSLVSPAKAVLTYHSADGEEGFPGAVSVQVTYEVFDNDTWSISYLATALDQDTVIALTDHTYWNLNGCQDLILEHELFVPEGNSYLKVNEHLVPTGEFGDVTQDFWLDFRTPKAVGKDIQHGTVTPKGGYDNAWVLSPWSPGQAPQLRLSVASPLSGIALDIYTDQPSFQIYSGNSLDGTLPTKTTQPAGFYQHWGALALEAQQLPDAVNHQNDPRWPSVLVRAGQQVTQSTLHHLRVLS